MDFPLPQRTPVQRSLGVACWTRLNRYRYRNRNRNRNAESPIGDRHQQPALRGSLGDGRQSTAHRRGPWIEHTAASDLPDIEGCRACRSMRGALPARHLLQRYVLFALTALFFLTLESGRARTVAVRAPACRPMPYVPVFLHGLAFRCMALCGLLLLISGRAGNAAGTVQGRPSASRRC